MDFEAYLKDKLIDSKAFQEHEPLKWQNFKVLFEQMHPNSFTVQKKFLINDLRRLYHYTPVENAPNAPIADPEEPKKPAKPMVKRAVVIKKTE